MSDVLEKLLLAVLGACVLLSPVACTMYQSNKIAEVIARGVDPIAANCALDSMASPRVCGQYVASHK